MDWQVIERESTDGANQVEAGQPARSVLPRHAWHRSGKGSITESAALVGNCTNVRCLYSIHYQVGE